MLKNSLLLAIILAASASSSTPKDTLVMAWDISSISTLDPAFIASADANEILSNVCDPLIFMDFKDWTNYVPGLAQSWTASSDGLAWQFTLRAGLTFPSGRPVRAEDVIWSIRRTLRAGATPATYLHDIGFEPKDAETHFRLVDDRKFEIRFKQHLVPGVVFPSLRLLRVLDKTEVLAHEQNGDEGHKWLGTNTACAGPFAVTRWNANESIVLTRNRAPYWRNPVSIQRVIIRHVPQPSSQRLLLEKADVDIARNLGVADLPDIRNNPATHIVSRSRGGIAFLSLNQRDPILRNPKVRQAFRYLIDYDTLSRTLLKEYGTIRQSFVPIAFFGALPAEDRPYSLNIAKARSLLAEAGYPDGFSKELLVGSQSPELDVAQNLQANAAKIGIQINLRPTAGAMRIATSMARRFDLYLALILFPGPDANIPAHQFAMNLDNSDAGADRLSPSWQAAWDVGRDSNELVLKAQVEHDPAKRRQIYFQLQRAQLKDAAVIPIYEVNRVLAVSNAVVKIQIVGQLVSYASVEKR